MINKFYIKLDYITIFFEKKNTYVANIKVNVFERSIYCKDLIKLLFFVIKWINLINVLLKKNERLIIELILIEIKKELYKIKL